MNQAPDQPDTTPPRLVRGEMDGDRMFLYFSEPLNERHRGWTLTHVCAVRQLLLFNWRLVWSRDGGQRQQGNR